MAHAAAQPQTDFNPALTEFTGIIDGSMVHVYRVGGGEDGRAYTGRWGYRVRRGGEILSSGEDHRTTSPQTHHEVAAAVARKAAPHKNR